METGQVREDGGLEGAGQTDERPKKQHHRDLFTDYRTRKKAAARDGLQVSGFEN